jgi:hypothetical protein
VIAGDGRLGLIAAHDSNRGIAIYDARTAEILRQVELDHRPLAARFIPEQKALLVMTANQTIYSIDLSSSEQTHVLTTEAN